METTMTTAAGSTLEIKSGELIATTKTGQTARVLLAKTRDLPPAHARKMPYGYRCLGTICLDPESAKWVDAHAAAAEAEREALRNQPHLVARREVDALYRKAESLRNYPADYFRAKQRADAALAAWREQYPEAAKAERKQDLLDAATNLERKAKDALLYDADGSLGHADQQRIHDDYMAQAAAKRAEAEAL